ncbi:MAG TPA: PRC and DUF2382 domain-containing protein [Micromonosporaceae bacterium]|nr:PRC and DUF2382 domain-containing protein [Micromonosporaceae bacterium]
MISRNDINQLDGATVYGSDGSKIGSVGQVYLDDQTGSPEWVSVTTGLFGTSQSFVPLSQASFSGDRVEVPFDKETVKGAPQIADDGNLSPAQEDELYTYYGMSSTDGRLNDNDTTTTYDTATYDTATSDTDRETVGHDTSGPSTDDAMTRSEERLTAGTRTEQVGKARLRKYVVTEQQQVTVPVSREEVTIEREPITDANRGAALDGPAISEEEHEVTLHAERPVVETEAVPVERVRLDKQTVTDQETVTGEVRKEEIEIDGPTDRDVNAR